MFFCDSLKNNPCILVALIAVEKALKNAPEAVLKILENFEKGVLEKKGEIKGWFVKLLDHNDENVRDKAARVLELVEGKAEI